MSNLKQFVVADNVIEILKQGSITDKVFFLPDVQIERSLYESVNKVLVALGAKWNKKSKGHIFEYDIASELNNVFKTGIATDWKKSTDFFYTPDVVVNEMLGQLPLPINKKFKVLEPSAGQGHILDILKENFSNAEIICIEKNPMHCEKLIEKGYSPVNDDFLNIAPCLVDVVLMNPPFSEEMEHIKHAFDFLDEDGILITIASAMILDRTTKQGKAFKQWYNDVQGYDYLLPTNSFKESGTGVNTKMLIINKIESSN